MMVPYWFIVKTLILKLVAETGAAEITSAAPETPYSGQPIQPFCCPDKIVGGILYYLTSQNKTVPSNCLSNCEYVREDQEGQQTYCFAAGNLEVECLDGGELFATTGQCLTYGVDIYPGGDCDLKPKYQNIQSPRQCYRACVRVARFAAWSWLNLNTDHPNPGQCVCKSCTTPIETDNYSIVGYRGCLPAKEDFLYGKTWCNINNDPTCQYDVFPNFLSPTSCQDQCSNYPKYQGFSWGNNQINNPNKEKCYCFTTPRLPVTNDFFVAGPV